ncbi:hypothetical protein GCG54_00013659 [Colletotrichum gloeosporioides]|uniref:Uncharacterized protein n=1 Tax=Colletotrichum gloeosporioides TaxID=474922 RepID=A0A8H4FL05_COLGL|nr:uncharacterized protein GCG54_00013659 [Colletotrichum gloeosporioides]KAF3805985.1 hypothetical protein GCG54_00013659 [Colletotrichum gloeosporioides]
MLSAGALLTPAVPPAPSARTAAALAVPGPPVDCRTPCPPTPTTTSALSVAKWLSDTSSCTYTFLWEICAAKQVLSWLSMLVGGP